MVLDTTWLFVIALIAAALSGAGLGALIESTLIRPLYSRPIYQLMLTIGLSYIGVQLVQAIWGRNEFIMPTPSMFQNTGKECPSTSIGAWLQITVPPSSFWMDVCGCTMKFSSPWLV